MSLRASLAALAGLAALLGPMDAMPAPPAPTPDLACSLSVVAGHGGVQGASLVFTIRNRGPHPVRVLAWHTPFEGWFGKFLEVSRDGETVPYDGAMAKRGAPVAQDYVVVRPGSERTAKLDLSLAYAVSPPGRYRVSFSGVLPDVRREGVADPADFRPVTLACAAAEFSVAGVAGR